MYTYLNQKYGLRSLIVEHASSIHRAVKRYSAENNDVAVFGLILRNEIDEEFRYVQKQLKETVADLLRVYLKVCYRHAARHARSVVRRLTLVRYVCSNASRASSLSKRTMPSTTSCPSGCLAMCTKRSGWTSSSTCTTTRTPWRSS